MSNPVMIWWSALVAVAVFNTLAWGSSAWRLNRGRADLPEHAYRRRRWLLVLSAGYVAGCAFRSVQPMVDVPRMCLHDTTLSYIFAGRTIATVAELCLAAQFAHLLREAGDSTGRRAVVRVSQAVFPLIVLAEVFSWSAVLTSNYLLHAVENSLWTVAAALGVAAFAVVRPQMNPRARSFLAIVIVCGLAYIAFMVAVDVPMYVSRWLADLAAGNEPAPLSAGLSEVLQRCTVVRVWDAWREDVPWLTLYFSIAVWISIALPHAPLLAPEAARSIDSRVPLAGGRGRHPA